MKNCAPSSNINESYNNCSQNSKGKKSGTSKSSTFSKNSHMSKAACSKDIMKLAKNIGVSEILEEII